MIRVSAYFLLLVMLVNSNPVLQLFKLPKLFEHYREHSLRDSDLSFVDFLSMHYWGNDANDQDDVKDRQLPFKSKIVINTHSDVVFTFPQIDLRSYMEYLNIVHNTTYEEAVTVKHTASLFRPPQVV